MTDRPYSSFTNMSPAELEQALQGYFAGALSDVGPVYIGDAGRWHQVLLVVGGGVQAAYGITHDMTPPPSGIPSPSTARPETTMTRTEWSKPDSVCSARPRRR